jgi:signal transduction histidine kinase
MDERLVSGRLVGDSDASFPRLVSLAAHDLRTPLATIHGFAQTLVRMNDLGEPKQRYLEMIDAAALQLAELLDERVVVLGSGANVRVDVDATQRGVAALAQAALRHGGLEQVDLRVDGVTLTIGPVTASSGPVLLGVELRDLGAAVGVRVIQANGGSVALDGELLAVTLPA